MSKDMINSNLNEKLANKKTIKKDFEKEMKDESMNYCINENENSFESLQAQGLNAFIPLLNSLNFSENDENLNENDENFNQNSTQLKENLYNFILQNAMAENLAGVGDFLSQTNEIMAKLESKTLSKDELVGFLSKLNYPLLGGMALGAGLAFVLNELKNQN